MSAFRTAFLRAALLPAVFGAWLASHQSAAAEAGAYCSSGECALCLFGGEERDQACIGPDSAWYQSPAADVEGGQRILNALSALRIGMSSAQAIEAVGREPDKIVESVKVGFDQVQLAGSFRFLLWERPVSFLTLPLQLFASFAEDRLIAVWLVPRSGDEFYADTIPNGACDRFADFVRARFGPQGLIAQLDESLFDHSTNVYQEGGLKWKPETRNLNSLASGDLWIAYHTIFTTYSNFVKNGTHYDRLESCRSQLMLVERR